MNPAREATFPFIERASPKIIEETRQYIRDFDRAAATTPTARGLYNKMLELYPDRGNPGGALWLSARRQTVI